MTDFCLDTENVLSRNDVDNVLQQIDMIFDTYEKEVFGEDYGSDFYQFLWDHSASSEEISEYTEKQIRNNVDLMGLNISVKTDFLEGTENDIILVSIDIFNDNYKTTKTYRID